MMKLAAAEMNDDNTFAIAVTLVEAAPLMVKDLVPKAELLMGMVFSNLADNVKLEHAVTEERVISAVTPP